MEQWLQRFTTWKPKEDHLVNYFCVITGIYLIWMGLLKPTASEIAQSRVWSGQSPLFSGMYNAVGEHTSAWLMLVFETMAGLLVLGGIKNRRIGQCGAFLAMLIFAGNVSYLFTNPIWAAGMGGFPFLGAGQNIVKYLSMFAIAAYIHAHHHQRLKGLTTLEPIKTAITWLAYAGVAIVMGWIGFLKFYAYEAELIVRLMESNILFSWMYEIWTVQQASNVIGTVEWVFLLCLSAIPWNKTLGRLGVAGICATALGTLTFMFTVPGWNDDAMFPLLNRTGVFVLKDQFLLACALLIGYRWT